MKKYLLVVIVVLVLIVCLFGKKTENEIAVVEKTTAQNEVIEYEELIENTDLFEVGDIINLENINYISSYAIPGKWKHTLLYLGTYEQFISFFNPEDTYYSKIISHYLTKKEILVLDSNSSGVKIRTFDQMANLKKDSYLKALTGYRFKENNDFIKIYLNHALDYLERPYDYAMITDDESKLYCSELIYYALQAVDIKITKTSNILDRKIITPSDLGSFLEALTNVEHCYFLIKENNCVINKLK